MRTSVQEAISPVTTRNTLDFSDAKVTGEAKAKDSTVKPEIDFGALLQNSNAEIKLEKELQKKGDFSKSTDNKDFLNNLSESTKIQPTSKNNLDKDDFMKLFVTQLQNQDPLNPDDGAEMAAKLAQFNAVEQQMNTNKKLEDLIKGQNSSNDQLMIHYLGKEVTVESGKAWIDATKNEPLSFSTAADAPSAILEIKDSSGTIVDKLELKGIKKGENAISWNPKDKNLTSGVYTYALSSLNTEGEMSPIEITTKAKVTGVDLKNGKMLRSTIGDLTQSDVQAIALNANETPGVVTKPNLLTGKPLPIDHKAGMPKKYVEMGEQIMEGGGPVPATPENGAAPGLPQAPALSNGMTSQGAAPETADNLTNQAPSNTAAPAATNSIMQNLAPAATTSDASMDPNTTVRGG